MKLGPVKATVTIVSGASSQNFPGRQSTQTPIDTDRHRPRSTQIDTGNFPSRRLDADRHSAGILTQNIADSEVLNKVSQIGRRSTQATPGPHRRVLCRVLCQATVSGTVSGYSWPLLKCTGPVRMAAASVCLPTPIDTGLLLLPSNGLAAQPAPPAY
jgi:hypothetical protein